MISSAGVRIHYALMQQINVPENRLIKQAFTFQSLIKWFHSGA